MLTWIKIRSLIVELISRVRQMESWMILRGAFPACAVFGSDLRPERSSRQAVRFRKHSGRCLEKRFQSPFHPLRSQSYASPARTFKDSETGQPVDLGDNKGPLKDTTPNCPLTENRTRTMANCGAGECSCECSGGKG